MHIWIFFLFVNGLWAAQPVNILINPGCEFVGCVCNVTTTSSGSNTNFQGPPNSLCYLNTNTQAFGWYAQTATSNFVCQNQFHVGTSTPTTWGYADTGCNFFANVAVTASGQTDSIVQNVSVVPYLPAAVVDAGLAYYYFNGALGSTTHTGTSITFAALGAAMTNISAVLTDYYLEADYIEHFTWRYFTQFNGTLPVGARYVRIILQTVARIKANWGGNDGSMFDSMKLYVYTSACLGYPPLLANAQYGPTCNATFTPLGGTCTYVCNAGLAPLVPGTLTATCSSAWVSTSYVNNNNWTNATGICVVSQSDSKSHYSVSHYSRSPSHHSESKSHHSHSHHSHSHQSKSHSHSHSSEPRIAPNKFVNILINGGCEAPGNNCQISTVNQGSSGYNFLPLANASICCANTANPATFGWYALPSGSNFCCANGWNTMHSSNYLVGSPYSGYNFLSNMILRPHNQIDYILQNMTLVGANGLTAAIIDAGLAFYYFSAQWGARDYTTNYITINHSLNTSYLPITPPVTQSMFSSEYVFYVPGNWGWTTFFPVSGQIAPGARYSQILLEASASTRTTFSGFDGTFFDAMVYYAYTSACMGYPPPIWGAYYSGQCNATYTLQGGNCTFICTNNLTQVGSLVAYCNSSWTNNSGVNNNWVHDTGYCMYSMSDSQSKSHQSDSDSHSKSHRSESHSKSHRSDSRSKSHRSDSRSHSKSHRSDSHSKSHRSDSRSHRSKSHSKSHKSESESESHSHSKSHRSDSHSKSHQSDSKSHQSDSHTRSDESDSHSHSKSHRSDSHSKSHHSDSDSHSKSHQSDSHTRSDESDSHSHSKSHRSDSHSKSHDSDSDSHSKSHQSDSHSKSHHSDSDSLSKSHQSDSHTRSDESDSMSHSKSHLSDSHSKSHDSDSDSRSKSHHSVSHTRSDESDSMSYSKSHLSDSHSKSRDSDSDSRSKSRHSVSHTRSDESDSLSSSKSHQSDSHSKSKDSDSTSRSKSHESASHTRSDESDSHSHSKSHRSDSHSKSHDSDSDSMSHSKSHSRSYSRSPETDPCPLRNSTEFELFNVTDQVVGFDNNTRLSMANDIPTCPYRLLATAISFAPFIGISIPASVLPPGTIIRNITCVISVYLTQQHATRLANLTFLVNGTHPVLIYSGGCNQYQFTGGNVISVSLTAHQCHLPPSPFIQSRLYFNQLLTLPLGDVKTIDILMAGLLPGDFFYIGDIAFWLYDNTTFPIAVSPCLNATLPSNACECTSSVCSRNATFRYVMSPLLVDNGQK